MLNWITRLSLWSDHCEPLGCLRLVCHWKFRSWVALQYNWQLGEKEFFFVFFFVGRLGGRDLLRLHGNTKWFGFTALLDLFLSQPVTIGIHWLSSASRGYHQGGQMVSAAQGGRLEGKKQRTLQMLSIAIRIGRKLWRFLSCSECWGNKEFVVQIFYCAALVDHPIHPRINGSFPTERVRAIIHSLYLASFIRTTCTLWFAFNAVSYCDERHFNLVTNIKPS